VDGLAEQPEPAEDRGRTHGEPGSEGENRNRPATRGTHGADHRQASGRPGAGEADEQPCQGERDGQHLIFVS
jgi:hypothetical protein